MKIENTWWPIFSGSSLPTMSQAFKRSAITVARPWHAVQAASAAERTEFQVGIAMAEVVADAGLEDAVGTRRGLLELRELRLRGHLGAEHHPVQRRMRHREAQVRQHHVEQPLARVVQIAQRADPRLEHDAKALRRDRRQVGDLAIEVVQRRRLRDPDVARRLAQAERVEALRIEDLDAAHDQRIAQVAVVIARAGRHAARRQRPVRRVGAAGCRRRRGTDRFHFDQHKRASGRAAAEMERCRGGF